MLDNGYIQEIGTYDELIKNKSAFYDFIEKQVQHKTEM